MGKLDKQVAIVTGSATGIGYGIAKRLASDGANIVMVDLDSEMTEQSASELASRGSSVEISLGDVSEPITAQEAAAKALDRWGRIDILVNNAGILADSTLKKRDPFSCDAVIIVNLRGVYLCGRAAASIMIEQGSGVILNASSVVAHHGNFGQTNYVASKAGVIGITKVWARELGKDGIRVNAVAPGFIQTNMTAGMPEKVVNMMGDKVPLKRWGQPEDVANAYTFLASDEASYITGAVLNVDGGVVV